MDTDNFIKGLSENLTPIKKQNTPNVFAIKYLLIALVIIATGVALLSLRTDIGIQVGNVFFIIDTIFNLMILVSGIFLVGWFSSAGRNYNQNLKFILPVIFILILGFNAYRLSLIPLFFNQFTVHMFDLKCFALIMLFSLFSSAVIGWTVRKRIVLHSGITGAMIGLVSFSIGSFVLNYHCPIADHEHVSIYHFILPMSLGTIIGFFTGRQFLKL